MVPWGGPWYHKSNFWQIGRTIPFWVSSTWQEIRVEVLLSGDWQLHEADGTWQAISKKRRLWSRKQVCLAEEWEPPHLNWENLSPVAWNGIYSCVRSIASYPRNHERQNNSDFTQAAEFITQFNTINTVHFLKILWKSRFCFILFCGSSSLEPSRGHFPFSLLARSHFLLSLSR